MGYVDRVIYGHCSNLSTDAKSQARNMLNRFLAAIAMFFLCVYGLYVYNRLNAEQSAFQAHVFNLSSTTIPKIFIGLDIVALFVFCFSTFYIAMIWIWVCWLKDKVNRDLAASATVESVLDDSFIVAFIKTYKSNMRKSAYWSTNHIIRVITTAPYAWYLVSVGRFMHKQFAGVNDEVATGAIFLSIIGLAFYLITWVSIAAGGVVNDVGYTLSARGISELVYKDDYALTPEKNQYEKDRFEKLRVDVLFRMQVMRSTTGIMFAGILLSVQKAVAVGSVLLTLMQISYK